MPKQLIGQYALIRRLHPEHNEIPRIKENFYKVKAGFYGERDYDKHLTEYKPRYPHAILHDVCLKQDGVYFQMDSLLVTQAFIVITEVKNFGGKIVVKSNPTQFILEYPTGERKVMKNPIAEIERKKFFLNEWLRQRKIKIPIIGMVALAFTNELIMEHPPETKILFTYEVPSYLRTLPIDVEKLSNDEIKNLAFEFRKNHQEYNPFPMTKTLNMTKSDIIPGVICPACQHRGMHWERRRWRCKKCNHAGSNCHFATLADWKWLISNQLTNSEFRNLTLLQNQQVAKRILARSGLVQGGKGRGSYYVMNEQTITNEITLHEM